MLLLSKKTLKVYSIQNTFQNNNDQKVYSCRLMRWDRDKYTFVLDDESPLLVDIANSSVYIADNDNDIRKQLDILYGF